EDGLRRGLLITADVERRCVVTASALDRDVREAQLRSLARFDRLPRLRDVAALETDRLVCCALGEQLALDEERGAGLHLDHRTWLDADRALGADRQAGLDDMRARGSGPGLVRGDARVGRSCA